MDDLDLQDKEAIASIAAFTNRTMAQNGRGVHPREAEKLNFNRRIDFRNHVNGYQPGNNFPPPHQFHQQFNHPNWQNNVPQNIPGWNAPYQDEQDPTMMQFDTSRVPQINIPPRLQNAPSITESDGMGFGGIEGSSFSVPDYSNPPQQQSRGNLRYSLEDEEEFRDSLIKEIKSLKKSINKLIREQERLILSVQSIMNGGTQEKPLEKKPQETTTEETIDDNSDKS